MRLLVATDGVPNVVGERPLRRDGVTGFVNSVLDNVGNVAPYRPQENQTASMTSQSCSTSGCVVTTRTR